MTKPLRWGILGAAKFAREHMAPAMMLAKNTELAALATSSADKAAAFTSLQPSLQVPYALVQILQRLEYPSVMVLT